MPRSANPLPFFRTAAAALALFLALSFAAPADITATTVDAHLSRSSTTLSEPVQLQIKISGARKVGDPPIINADGLSVHFVTTAQNSTVRIDEGGMRRENTIIFVYEVRGEQHGTFTIPSVSVEADGQKLRTRPVEIAIKQKADDDDADGEQKLKFSAEFILPKKTLYVGESVPAELRLYADVRVRGGRGHVSEMPSITAEGITMQKMPEPRQLEQPVSHDGVDCDLVFFKTAITPTKAGELSLGPGEIPFEAQIPGRRRTGSSFFDTFGGLGDDPFFARVRRFKIVAEPVKLTVKPLPVAGRPLEFSGAVGSFDITAEGTPKRVKIGDPLTMKIHITGTGNFDRVMAPALKDEDGWRTYPPSNTFVSDPDLRSKGEDVGIKGTKTFEMAVIPEAKKNEMPVFEFAYFDPATGKYVTKTTQPAALLVEGAPPSTPPPVANADASSGAAPAPAQNKKAAVPNDILGQRYDSSAVRQTFEPVYAQKEFLYAQGIPLLTLLGFLGWRLRPQPNLDAVRVSALRREKSALLEKLNHGEIEHAEFFDTAARVVQIDTALSTGKDVNGVDAAAARSSVVIDDQVGEVIDEIFKTRAELLYAGGGASTGYVPGDERKRVLAALTNFTRSHGKN